MLPRYYDVLEAMPTSVNGRIMKSELQRLPLSTATVDRKSTQLAEHS
jgi:hypothetical protein